MKINWNKRYTTYAIYAGLVSAAVIFFVFLGVYFDSIWSGIAYVVDAISPLLYGLIIAYILSPVLNFFEKKILVKIRHGVVRRGFGVFFTYLIFMIVIGLLLYAVVPQIGYSLRRLQSNLALYTQEMNDWLANLSADSGFLASIVKSVMNSELYKVITSPMNQIVDFILELIKDSGSEILGALGSFMGSLTKIIVGLVFSGYILCSKEMLFAQCNKLLHVLFKPQTIDKIKSAVDYTDKTFGKYIVGELIDALFVGVLTAVSLLIFRMPYIPLISVIAACTNIIPIFGPFIGAIPSFIFIFISDPFKALWYIVIVIVIQQIDGNIVAPRILGNSTGLPAVLVIVAITVMGGLFGIVGMVIGVPVFAILTKVIKDKTEAKEKAKLEEDGTQITIEDVEAVTNSYDYYDDSHREKDRIIDSGETFSREDRDIDEAEEKGDDDTEVREQ